MIFVGGTCEGFLMSTVTGVVDPFCGGAFMVAVAFARAFVSFVVFDFVEVDAILPCCLR